jgi:PIN domain nuclease of toxin-antitoxin system
LSQLARAILSDDQLCLSAASAWEIAAKYRLGKLPEAEMLLPNFRLIAAQAKLENIPLPSNDVAFDQFPIQRIW